MPAACGFWQDNALLKRAIKAGFDEIIIPWHDDPVHWGDPVEAEESLDELQGLAKLRLWVPYAHYWKKYKRGEYMVVDGTKYRYTPRPDSKQNLRRLRKAHRLARKYGARIILDTENYSTDEFNLFDRSNPAGDWDRRFYRKVRGVAPYLQDWILDAFPKATFYDERNYKSLRDWDKLYELSKTRRVRAGCWIDEAGLGHAYLISQVYGKNWWWWSDRILSGGRSWVLVGQGPPWYHNKRPGVLWTKDHWSRLSNMIANAPNDIRRPIWSEGLTYYRSRSGQVSSRAVRS